MTRPVLALILGVHRSGTSALTAGLQAAGAATGDIDNRPDMDNPRGYFENRAVIALNDRILAALGASWDDFAFDGLAVDWDSPHLAGLRAEAAAQLRADYAGTGPFVLKDPRISSLLPFWLGAGRQAGFDLRCILTLRDPAEVAASQMARARRRPDDFAAISTPAGGAALWCMMMRTVLRALPPDGAFLLDHATLLAQPQTVIAACAAWLGLQGGREGAAAAAQVVDPALNRAKAGGQGRAGTPDPWTQLARQMHAALTDGALPRHLPAADAAAMVPPQLEALVPWLAPAHDAIGRMANAQYRLRDRIHAADDEAQHLAAPLRAAVWAMTPLVTNCASARQLADLRGQLADTADTALTLLAARIDLATGQARRAVDLLSALDRDPARADAAPLLAAALVQAAAKPADGDGPRDAT